MKTPDRRRASTTNWAGGTGPNPARIEVVGFFNDYDNLLGRDSLASGGSGDGALFNGGAATVRGVELSASTDPGQERRLEVWGSHQNVLYLHARCV